MKLTIIINNSGQSKMYDLHPTFLVLEHHLPSVLAEADSFCLYTLDQSTVLAYLLQKNVYIALLLLYPSTEVSGAD